MRDSIIVHGIAPLDSPQAYPPSTFSLWIVATGLAVASLFRAENGLIVLYVSTIKNLNSILKLKSCQPALTPLLLTAQACFPFQFSTSTTTDTSILDPLVESLSGSILFSLFCILSVVTRDHLATGLSAIPTIALFFVYLSLMSDRETKYLPRIHLAQSLNSLSWRVATMMILALIVQTYFFGITTDGLAVTVVSALAKTSSWFFMIRTVGTSRPDSEKKHY
jgi:hypothetical protein